MIGQLSVSDWITLAPVGLVVLGKCCTDVAAYLTDRHNAGLARIVGMAGREAAGVAVDLAALPPGASATDLKAKLIRSAADHIMSEMGASAWWSNADADRVAGIVQGELNKLQAPQTAIPLTADAPPSSPPLPSHP